MSLGTTPEVEDLYSSSARLCDDALSDTSIFKLLYRFGDEIFPDEFFCDLYDNLGRAKVKYGGPSTDRRLDPANLSWSCGANSYPSERCTMTNNGS